MTSLLFAAGALLLILGGSDALLRKNLFPQPLKINFTAGDFGEPLFLTPYIESGNIAEARRLSKVGQLPNTPQIDSYAGYLTVNKQFNSNTFFWFFPALHNPETAPVLVWLQGGPGGSSLFGLFLENGPFVIGKDLSATLRKYSWVQKYSVIYIDNPVGTGFSFTDNDAGYAINETDVARDLYEALQQFFTIFSDYRGNDFYVTGESYAGKYVPAIAYKIHEEGAKANISLKGIAIGDGLCDPETMSDYGDYLYQIGLLDKKQADFFRAEQAKAVQFIKNEQYFEAFKIFDMLLNGDLVKSGSYFQNATGLNFYYNFLRTQQPDDFNYYNSYLAIPEVRKAIHVGNLTYNDGNTVEVHLINDIMRSVKPWVATLMDNYKVLMYSGQLDIIVAAPLTENFLQSIDWKHADEYKNADRYIWKVDPKDTEVAGYVRVVHDFYQVVVRDAGHILPYDKPREAFDMLDRFINRKSFQ